MADTTLLLVDLQDSFAIITKHQKVKIDYGLYSMMISSVNFDDIIATFNDERFTDIIGKIAELRSSIQYININCPAPDMQDKCIELIKELSSLLYIPLRSLLNTGHLKSKQLSTITDLFVNEFTNHLLSDYFCFEDRSSYVPSALHNIDFKAHIKSLMLRSTKNLFPSLQQEMNNLKLTATMTMINGTPYTVYHITNTLEFLLVDLQKYLTGKKTAKECLYCQRLFFPVHRSTVDYCSLPYKETGKSCYYLKRHTPKDDLEALYFYAKRQQAKKRDYPTNVEKYGLFFLNKIYQEWEKDCTIQYAKARRTNNIEAFKNWIEDTKFLKKRLEELYNLQKKEG
ncbi:hypothetical protein [Velocimicrobium porci]|uniref:Uncharacterized protein n=1 Tax=Velocimicrobium porci TaxID=2606634 RepID=A0A6L5Y0C9_9FIRM|nr:hypothetical protein [Velocimicrobium porci]MSS64171.1 hypothetical protein [Velocimicrobium porci]